MTSPAKVAAKAAPVAVLDLASAALNMAVAAADRRRARRAPLSRREALREAPWVPEMALSGVHEHAFRAAYADRLIERGLALPSSTGRSGPSGQHAQPRMVLSVSEEQRARWREAAEREGVTLSEWIRRAAEGRAALG
jgi:hypothetical protein